MRIFDIISAELNFKVHDPHFFNKMSLEITHPPYYSWEMSDIEDARVYCSVHGHIDHIKLSNGMKKCPRCGDFY